LASAEMRLELCFNSIALAIVTVWTNDKHFALLLTKLSVKNADATVRKVYQLIYITFTSTLTLLYLLRFY